MSTAYHQSLRDPMSVMKCKAWIDSREPTLFCVALPASLCGRTVRVGRTLPASFVGTALRAHRHRGGHPRHRRRWLWRSPWQDRPDKRSATLAVVQADAAPLPRRGDSRSAVGRAVRSCRGGDDSWAPGGGRRTWRRR